MDVSCETPDVTTKPKLYVLTNILVRETSREKTGETLVSLWGHVLQERPEPLSTRDRVEAPPESLPFGARTAISEESRIRSGLLLERRAVGSSGAPSFGTI